MSTYITALVAGPYHRVSDSYSGTYGTYPLDVYCRESLAAYLDHEEIFTVTHDYPNRRVELHFFACALIGEPVPQLGQQMRWVQAAGLFFVIEAIFTVKTTHQKRYEVVVGILQ